MSIIFNRALFVFLIFVAAVSVAVYAIGGVNVVAGLLTFAIIVIVGAIIWSV